MCSLTMLSPKTKETKERSSFIESLNNSLEFDANEIDQNRKFSLKLDMNKVAKVDDTFIVKETDFEEDTLSADEFKERLLNTNLIIHKKGDSWQQCVVNLARIV